MSQSSIERPLRIVHVIRAPLGGLFRHVLDLSREQIARGHQVGLIADSTTGGEMADRVLAELAPKMTLGLTRLPMRRNPHPSDALALTRVISTIRASRPDVVHGHGSKGAVYARVPAMLPGGRRGPIRVYTPHGGSLHYAPGSRAHAIYMAIERMLGRYTDLMQFESAYIAARYEKSVGVPPCLARVTLNGIAEKEFEPIEPAANAADFVYVGELRAAKGIDTWLDALAQVCASTGRRLTAVLVGSGPDRASLQAQAERLGLLSQISFPGPMPARQGFALGRTLIVPSRAESLPYVVLEAAGAQVPMIATDVGGIPEIFGPYRDRLVRCDIEALKAVMIAHLDTSDACRRAAAADLAAFVHGTFSIERMVDGVLAGYREAIALKGASATERHTLSRLHPRGLGS